MAYAIELSLSIGEGSCWTSMIEERKQLANKHKCDIQYFTHEIEGKGNKITKNESIHVVIFDKDCLDNLISYINEIRSYKKNYIECIYQDDITCNLLYASPQYIRKMERSQAINFKKERKFWIPETDVEKKIYEAMKRRNYSLTI